MNAIAAALACAVVAAGADGAAPAGTVAPPGGAGAAPLVEVVAAGGGTQAAALREVVTELLGRLPVRLAWSEETSVTPTRILARSRAFDSAPPTLARVWIDLSEVDRAKIYIADARHDRFVARTVPLAPSRAEVGRETLAHVLESTVDALLAGRVVGVPRDLAAREIADAAAPTPEVGGAAPAASPRPVRVAGATDGGDPAEAPSPAPTRASPRPRARSAPPGAATPGRGFELTYGAFYRAEVRAAALTIAHGPGVDIVWRARAGRHARADVRLAAVYVAPFDWTGTPAGARLQGSTGWLELGVTPPLGGIIGVRIAGGVGVDVLRVTPVVPPAGTVTASPPFWKAAPLATLGVGVTFPLARTLGLIASGGATADLAGNHFDVERADGSRTTALSPYRVRPWLALGLSFSP